jgi:hypothetical protein
MSITQVKLNNKKKIVIFFTNLGLIGKIKVIFFFGTRKLINTNRNTDENISSVNCSEFY